MMLIECLNCSSQVEKKIRRRDFLNDLKGYIVGVMEKITKYIKHFLSHCFAHCKFKSNKSIYISYF